MRKRLVVFVLVVSSALGQVSAQTNQNPSLDLDQVRAMARVVAQPKINEEAAAMREFLATPQSDPKKEETRTTINQAADFLNAHPVNNGMHNSN